MSFIVHRNGHITLINDWRNLRIDEIQNLINDGRGKWEYQINGKRKFVELDVNGEVVEQPQIMVENPFALRQNPLKLKNNMNILNLVNPINSSLQFSVITYPDKQPDIQILDVGNYDRNNQHLIDRLVRNNETICIHSRMNGFQDIELIIAATKALNRVGIKNVSLYSPYFLGARCDRKFEEGGTFYLKDVITPIINSLNFNEIFVADAHSTVLNALLDNMKEINMEHFINDVIFHIKEGNDDLGWNLSDSLDIIIPDAGAEKRVIKNTQHIFEGIKNAKEKPEYVLCAKQRNHKGEIVGTFIPKLDFKQKDVLIIDDICSKGGTFIALAKQLQKLNVKDIYLATTHYEGTADIGALKKAGIKKVFSTNSISDVETEYIKKWNIFNNEQND